MKPPIVILIEIFAFIVVDSLQDLTRISSKIGEFFVSLSQVSSFDIFTLSIFVGIVLIVLFFLFKNIFGSIKPIVLALLILIFLILLAIVFT